MSNLQDKRDYLVRNSAENRARAAIQQRTENLDQSFLYNRLQDEPELTVNLNLFKSEMNLMWECGRQFGHAEAKDILENV